MLLCLTQESHITTIVRHSPFPKKRKKIANADFRIAPHPPFFFFIYFLEFDPWCRIARERTEEEKVFFCIGTISQKKGKQESSLVHTHMQTSLAAIERGLLKIFSREEEQINQPGSISLPFLRRERFAQKSQSCFFPAAGEVERCSV